MRYPSNNERTGRVRALLLLEKVDKVVVVITKKPDMTGVDEGYSVMRCR